ncbi:mucin-22 [Daphnia magna]|uniref:mucin-22 n=1 Tax=Daphnia magna TaxID=35525 RepID=UPI001E1BCB77|nr:mucin-22 [Daphnia magna]
MWVRSTSDFISSAILDAASSFTIIMRSLFNIVLLGALVLANVSGEVDSTRESLERSTFDDQTDDNEKVIHAQSLATIESFLRSPVNVSKDTQTGRIKLPPIDSGGPQVSDANEGDQDSKNSEEAFDLSSEGNPLQLETHTIASVNQSVTVDPAAQVVNATTSSDAIKTRMAISAQGQRTIATNKLLQNRLDRSRTTTTTANPISGHSDEEGDDFDRKTTARTNRFGSSRITTARSSKESSEQDDSVKTIQTTVKPIQSTITTRNLITGKFGRFRTTTVSAIPVSNNSDEEIGLTKPIVTTTVRTTGNRFNRVQTTTVSTRDASAEEIQSVREVKTAPSLTFGNRFGRVRTTTPVSKDSDEEVKEIQTTTVRPPLPNNRFNRFKTTTVAKPVTQESKEQGSNVTTSTSVPLKLLIGNPFNRIRTTTAAAPISDTSDETAESVNVTQTTTSRTSTSSSRLNRFRTTSAPASKKDSEEQDDVVNVTSTTTLRPSAFRNLFSRTRTTTSSPISRDSIEEEDLVNKTSTTTVRSLPTRKLFGLPRTVTVPARISISSDEDVDVVNKTETTTTRRFLVGNRFGLIRTTTLRSVTTTSQHSDEEIDVVNATLTTTARSLAAANRFKGFRITTPASRNSEEQVGSVNSTQTNARNSLLRNRLSRLQTTTTTTSIPIADHSDEQVDSETQTTPPSSQTPAATSSDSNEQDDMNNGTETTTDRSQVTLKYSNRYRTTTVRNLTLENSDEQEDDSVSTTEMTSSFQIPSTTKTTPLTPASKLVADKATVSSEIANLERKDRAIIYNAKTNVIVNQPDKLETTTSVPITQNYFMARHSDELDDDSDDEDISSILYTYIEFRTTALPTASEVDEDNSAEVDDFSLESKDSVTEKPEHKAAGDDRVAIVSPEDVSTANKSDDVSAEFIIVVTNNSESTRNKTAAFLRGAKLLMDSDEGNDVSTEGEGSGDVANEEINQYQTTPVQQDARVVSDEGDDASAETEISRDITNRTSPVEQSIVESEELSNVSTDAEVSGSKHGVKMNTESQTESVEQDVDLVTESDEGNTTSAEVEVNNGALSDNREDVNKTSAELAQDSDEKDESSLEVDVSKLPDIKRLLTDVGESSTEAEDKTAAVQSESHVLFPDIEKLFKLDVDNQTAAPARSTNQTLIEEANKKKEVNMKIRELLTNPKVQERLQERLQAIDGRLKDSKSARVKRLIEKYLAALAKLSPSSNSATSFSFSVLLPLMATCLLLGFS